MEFTQQLLTAAAEVIAIAGISGIILHAIYTQHQRFMTEFCPPVAPYQPEVKEAIVSVEIEQPLTQQEVKLEVITEISQASKKLLTEAIPTVDAALESLKEAAKPRKKATQPKLQPMSVGAAAVDYATMTSEQLRRECALQFIDWRTGGDYGKPMKKAQMLAALR